MPSLRASADARVWPASATAARGQAGEWRSRPISRVLSWTVIPLGAASPLRSSSLPGDTAGRGIVSLFGLAPGGVCRAGPLPDSRCALTAPFHPYHARLATPFGGLLSVALSVGSRRPGVTWHRALWSPDFPRHSFPSKWIRMTRLPGRLRRGNSTASQQNCPQSSLRNFGPRSASPKPRRCRGAPFTKGGCGLRTGGRCRTPLNR